MLRRAREFVGYQLRQGATPEGLALTCAMGFLIALFPVLGATTVLCLGAGYLMKLNQPTLQAVNYVLAPVQLLMIPVYIKAGAWVFQVPAVSVNPKTIIAEFMDDPGKFLSDYGFASLQSIVAWALLTPLVAFVVYRVLLMIFRSAKRIRG
ncbi:DUF2062 domain-containing protein [Bdellovibrio svalbardensis]|uniref:DUF2062 domain-containing protein n=1 Tax=Bdellovibrio svalbardensis TaxID=2972972 RepID=A0ABT6DP00_9BACT|nr:DUF2062 domain-containing protein [Bdellovibrio svalbardensis]MDG0817654.1 DUF2062 domain-containing protein [Bdellovibrio svalbardensis]